MRMASEAPSSLDDGDTRHKGVITNSNFMGGTTGLQGV
jgi:hypothetical protein